MAKKWTYDACLLEAKKYNTKADFLRSCESAYKIAYRNGWLKDYDWFFLNRKPDGYWSIYENCYKEAKKYKTISAFKKQAGRAYVVSTKNGWINDYLWFEERQKPNGFWNSYEHCYEEARKYKTRNEFHNKKKWAYNSARKNGWLDDYIWFEIPKRPGGYWTENKCYQEAKKYASRIEFNDNSSGAYYSAKKNGWLDSYTWFKKPIHDKDSYCVYAYFDDETKSVYIGLTYHLKERHYEHKHGKLKSGVRVFDTVANYFKTKGEDLPSPIVLKDNLNAEEAQYFEDFFIRDYKDHGYNVLNLTKAGSLGGTVIIWDKETCREEAKKYKSRNEFAKSNSAAYNAAWKGGWLNDYVWFNRPVNPKKRWDYDSCYKEAQKYLSKIDFIRCNYGAYQVAWKNGWISEYQWFKRPAPRVKWDYERCKEESKKFSTRNAFRKGSNGAYASARKNGWIEEFFPKKQ